MTVGDDAHASERQDAVVLFKSGWQHYQKAHDLKPTVPCLAPRRGSESRQRPATQAMAHDAATLRMLSRCSLALSLHWWRSGCLMRSSAQLDAILDSCRTVSYSTACMSRISQRCCSTHQLCTTYDPWPGLGP